MVSKGSFIMGANDKNSTFVLDFNKYKSNDLTRLKEKLNHLQGDIKSQDQTAISKRRTSRNVDNKENIDLDTFEAETARIHREFIEGA
jgi:hypothetical protein